MLLQLEEVGKTTSCSRIEDLLFTYGFGNVWSFHGVGDDEKFLKIFTIRIKDCFTLKWQSEIEKSSKGNHYRYFKSVLDPEIYYSTGLSHKILGMFANLRCSPHDLMIEKVRNLAIIEESRFCPICKGTTWIKCCYPY